MMCSTFGVNNCSMLKRSCKNANKEKLRILVYIKIENLCLFLNPADSSVCVDKEGTSGSLES